MERLGEALSRASQGGGCRTVSRSKRVTVDLTLGAESIEITPVGKRRVQRTSLLLADIVFVKPLGERCLVVGAMSHPVSKQSGCFAGCSRRKSSQREFRKISLEFSNGASCQLICELMSEVSLNTSYGDRAPALCVVNPVAGKGKALTIWKKTIEPLLKNSERFDYEMVITDKPGHALEIGQSVLVDKLAHAGEGSKVFLIVIGGDGIVYELLNGLFNARRHDYQTLLKRLVLCPLPAGSGNGLCFSSLLLAGESFSMNAALRLLLRQQSGPKDLGIVHYESDDPFLSPSDRLQSRLFALTISWGLVADVDIQSEFLRSFFGDSRFTVYGLYKVVQKQQYEGTLTFGAGSQEIEPDYLTIFATLVPVAGRTVILSTDKQLDSGAIHIHRLRGREISRLGLIRAMDELEQRRNHVGLIPGFEPLVVDNFELVPGMMPVPGSAGIVVDGEPLTSAPIRVELIPAACSVFTA